MRLAIAPALLALLAPLSWAPDAVAAQVESFSPQGEVKDVRQVVARFSADVVAFGDPRLAAPFDVACPAKGAGRWADARNWVYDFDGDLPAGLACTFTLNAAFRDLAGEPLGGERTFAFTTGGPAVRQTLPYSGSRGIDEQQVFIFALDAAATPASIEKHAWCEVDGVGERIPLRVLRGAERRQLLDQRAQLGYQYLNLLIVRDADGALVGRGRVQTRQQMEQAEQNLAVVQCRRTLPAGHAVSLLWGRGIATAGGAATTEEQRIDFRVRDEFVARFSCERANADADCLPMLPLTLEFSAPVARELAARVRLVGEDGKALAPAAPTEERVERVRFAGPFPEKHKFQIRLPAGIRDDAGRPLANAKRFPLEVRTDEAPPLAKFAGTFGILEARDGGLLPVTLRNLDGPARGAATVGGRSRRIENEDEIHGWLDRVRRAARGSWDAGTYTPPGARSVLAGDREAKPLSVIKPLGAHEFEVAPIALGKPGLYVVELESPKLGQALHGTAAPYYVPTVALVTNLSVHFTWGRESSTAWVTRLDDATVVPNAAVKVLNACTGETLWKGRTGADGIARIDADLPEPSSWLSCESTSRSPELLVGVRDGDDFSFVLASWHEGISPGDFGNIESNLWQGAQRGYAHTVLDRTLFRAGETVSMKHYVREPHAGGLRVPAELPPAELVIRHGASGKTFDLEFRFDRHGIGETQWAIPQDAPLGLYELTIVGERYGQPSGSFRVEQFKLPVARAQIQGPKAPLVGAKSVTLDLNVTYLAGGGSAKLPVKLRTLVQPRAAKFKHYEEFAFGGEAVREGFVEQAAGGWFPEFDDETGEALERGQSKPTAARTVPLTLDDLGTARTQAPLPAVATAQDLVAELEYSDPNGQILTTSTRIALWPSALNLGLRTEGWIAAANDVNLKIAVLDTQGAPQKGVPVAVEVFHRETHSYRKRLVGGFYTYAHTRKVVRVPARCAGTSDELGTLACHLAPGVSGELLVQARAKDAGNREAVSVLSVWVAGKDDWWFSQQPNERMDLLPERKEYQPGERARFQVRMPFRAATALVSVEREGVLEQFVTQLEGDKPVIEVPLKGSYAPNVYVSVLAVRGRARGDWLGNLAERAKAFFDKAGASRPPEREGYTALADLSKPAFRLGLANVAVGLKAHRLEVGVSTDRQVYNIRDTARVRVSVRQGDGKPAAGGEIALAAVDEALLELQPNASWRLLETMMASRPLSVMTATAQTQVVGKRQYGRKTTPPGGGGGRLSAREVFDTLLLWKGRVPLDANGQATIEVPLNDALTSFRIVAVANRGEQQFGTGSATVRTHQDLQLIAALPPVVREGDAFRAAFAVRNASAAPMKAEVKASVRGRALAAQLLDIPAGEAREAAWDLDVPVDAGELDWDVEARDAKAVANPARDRLKMRQSVVEAFPVRIYQATLTQLDKPFTLAVRRPEDAVPGRGGVRIELMRTLGGTLDGVREYMGRYPWNCIEQRLSRAIVLDDAGLWRTVRADMAVYLDGDGLLRFYPSGWLQGSDTLTAYALSVTHEAGWEIPDDTRDRMLGALDRFVRGRLTRGNALHREDQVERKLAALEALARHGRAHPDAVDALAFQPALLPTSALLDWIGVLQRVEGVRDRETRLAQALQILRARINFQGTVMTFSTERDDAWWWLMASADRNSVVSVLRLLDDPAWASDLPRLWRGAWLRQKRGHWDTTLANAWGTLAARRFREKFESESVDGDAVATFADQQLKHDWDKDSGALEFPWPGAGAGKLTLEQDGDGAPWAIVQSRAALPLKQPLSSGYRIEKTVSVVDGAGAGYKRGAVLRVRLEIDAQTDMTWVAIDDPVPPGAMILGSGLGGDSALLARGEKREGHAWLAYEERRHDSYRAYYEFVPKGKFAIEYTLRLNTPGHFKLPATRIEAMYAPEMFGERPNPAVEVGRP
jgi:uncharacterized protein YfaS (alpha-2-macroglobulin family)